MAQMSERRRFLKTASLLSLSALAPTARAEAASTNSSLPVEEPDVDIDTIPFVPPGPPDPIKEQPFTDYHLLGNANPDANLFGKTRPKDWRNTKAQLKVVIAAEPILKNDPIQDWLATFDTSFDERAASIVLSAAKYAHPAGSAEPNYEPQLYDASLRAASVLLDRCLRYRNQMGSLEMAGVSAGIGYLSFIKLRPIQRNFLIQSNAADLAEIERTTEAKVAHRYHQIWGLARLFERRQLQAREAEANGFSNEAGRAEAKDNFLSMLLQKQFHYQIDAQLAQFTRLISPGSSSNFAERYLRMLALLTEDLADAYCKLYSASKGIQSVLGLTSANVGLNTPINVDIPLFTTTAAIAQWVQAITQSGNQKAPDILDALVLWTRALMRVIDTNSQYETEFTVSIPLLQLWGKSNQNILQGADNTAAFPGGGQFSGKLSFPLPVDALPVGATATNIRTLGVGLSVEFSRDDASPVEYITGFPGLPANAQQTTKAQAFEQNKMARLNATITTPTQTMQGGATYSRPPVFLANVRVQGGNGGDLEPALCYDPACRGLNPFGRWTISFDLHSLEIFPGDASVENLIKGFILHLRLRGNLA
jgi:hypothetical protein